ncbi:MAG: DNA helicase Rep [Gammaproteobacteria bacterium]|nr:DNA helicase Rep [Gammaproteobacteria bacterium]
MANDLNSRQREAIRYLDGPLLVLAGAGSGKTRVITHKMAWLIEEAGLKARHIAAVTFTNKAAREMKTRVSRLLPQKAAKGLIVSTFHTLGLNIIRRELKVLGLKSGFSIFDAQDSAALVRTLADQNGTLDTERLQALHWQIDRWKNALISPEQAMGEAENPQEQAAAGLYEAYQRHLQAYNAVDFNDLIGRPAALFLKYPEVRERWQQRIHYLLVDEYQDTNAGQYQLVKLICGIKGALTVVGDDDQSIYAWRGAQPENLNLLKQDFPRLKVVKLEQNYRSSARILRVANRLIGNNPHVFSKNLWSDKGIGEPLRALHTKDDAHEAERVISELITHKFQNHTNHSDYAILYRSNFQSRLFEQKLRDHGIPYFLSGGTSFFARTEVKDIMAYLRLLANPDDDSAFLRVINTPRREIGAATLEKLGNYARGRELSLFAAGFEMGLAEHLSARALQRLLHFLQWLSDIGDRAAREDPIAVAREMVKAIDYETWLKDTCKDIKTAERRMENVGELLSWLQNLLENSTEHKTLADLVAHITLMDVLERQEEEDQSDRVSLMTLHAAKGLEFPHVFMVGMEEDLLPHANNKEEEEALQEERRLAYVGITRARKSITFSLAARRKRYGEQISREPSRFLGELPKEDLVWEGGKQQIDPKVKQARGRAHLANIQGILGGMK